MVLGDATKKLQKLLDTAEKLYGRVADLREEVDAMRDTVQETSDAVERLERDLDDQRALLSALARERGIDVDRVLAEAAIEEAEPTPTDEGDASGEPAGNAGPDE